MNKKILFLSLSFFQVAMVSAMQGLQDMPSDVMKVILEYVMWVDVKDVDQVQTTQACDIGLYEDASKKKKYDDDNGLQHTIKRNCALQLVSQYFKTAFWYCLRSQERFSLLEKDTLIAHFKDQYCWPKKGYREGIPVLDIAVSIQASLYPIFMGAIYTPHINSTCNPQMVGAILEIAGDKVLNGLNNGFLPIWYAIAYDHLEIVKLLLTHPAIQVNPKHGQSCPLYWAVYYKKIEMVKLLLAHPDIEVNAANSSNGETPLFAVISSRMCIDKALSMIDLLIKAGADSTIKNKDGETALDLARRYKNTDKVEALEKALAMKKL